MNQTDELERLMKKSALAIAIITATMACGTQAAIQVTGIGGFVEDSDLNFIEPNSYLGCNTDGICTSFTWGTAQDPDLPPPNSFGGSGASINAMTEASLEQTPEDNAEVVIQEADGVARAIGSLTHWNVPIQAAFGPATIEVSYSFFFEDTVTGDTDELTDVTFEVTFRETANTQNIADCDPTPNPSGSEIPCDDWFEFSGDPLFEFQLGENKYSFEIFGFCDMNLDPMTCRSNIINDPTGGRLYTPEGGSSSGLVYEIKRPIPGPGALALVGAGLVALGYVRRRKTGV
jgi:hypothetical protein